MEVPVPLVEEFLNAIPPISFLRNRELNASSDVPPETIPKLFVRTDSHCMIADGCYIWANFILDVNQPVHMVDVTRSMPFLAAKWLAHFAGCFSFMRSGTHSLFQPSIRVEHVHDDIFKLSMQFQSVRASPPDFWPLLHELPELSRVITMARMFLFNFEVMPKRWITAAQQDGDAGCTVFVIDAVGVPDSELPVFIQQISKVHASNRTNLTPVFRFDTTTRLHCIALCINPTHAQEVVPAELHQFFDVARNHLECTRFQLGAGYHVECARPINARSPQ